MANGAQCDPMGDGCKALTEKAGAVREAAAAAIAELRNQKAGKSFVDDRFEKQAEDFTAHKKEVTGQVRSLSNRVWAILFLLLAQCLAFVLGAVGYIYRASVVSAFQ